jgi:hypothetical protein
VRLKQKQATEAQHHISQPGRKLTTLPLHMARSSRVVRDSPQHFVVEQLRSLLRSLNVMVLHNIRMVDCVILIVVHIRLTVVEDLS